VSLVVDSIFPVDRLTALLRQFNDRFPTVPVRLLVESLGGVERAVRDDHAGIGVGNQLHMNMTGFRRIDIEAVRMIPVAAPGHPLARAGGGAPREPSDYIQLILSERSAADSRDYGVVSLNSWRIGDLGVKHALLLAGLGWGGMPEPAVRADLKTGRLVKLNLRNWRGGEYNLQAVHKVDTPPGPAGRWLIERLAILTDTPPG
jgi:DNA-binding transcriptional LysR family regulator